MEGGGREVEGSVQPSKSTSRVKEESQDVGPPIPSHQLARFVFRGTDLMRNRGLSYLIYTRRVKFVFMCHDWSLVALAPRRHPSLTTCLKLPKTLQRGQWEELRRSNLRCDGMFSSLKKVVSSTPGFGRPTF